MAKTVHQIFRLNGKVSLPPDKSIAHRSALLSAIGEGTSRIENFSTAGDPQSTLACLRQLGVGIEADGGGTVLHVHGNGLGGLRAPEAPLDCGNAGTAMRLLAGLLAGQPFDSTLTGDASLCSRPMERIADPLRQMGADIELTEGCAPIRLRGGAKLQGITYRLPVASAQVKSCVLLAGLFAEGETTVVEPVPSRDHTERMLGLDVLEMEGTRHLTIRGGRPVAARTWAVPGDFSAAAFFITAATLVPGSELRFEGVGLNPTRCALLNVLCAMGADIAVEDERTQGGEPVGDLTARAAHGLQAVQVGGQLIPNLIDEIPILAVAATQAEGRTVISDAAELRVKETDRLAATAEGLRAMGATIEECPDGLVIEGPAPLRGAVVDAQGDHRMAMALGIAALLADGPTEIHGAEHARISFSSFWEELERLS